MPQGKIFMQKHDPLGKKAPTPGEYFKKIQLQGGHKPGKHEKPGKLRKFEKLLKSRENSGKFEFL